MATFKETTEFGIKSCGQWMIDNAEKLSEVINDGCTNWSITFNWDTLTDAPSIPKIDINVSKYPGRKIIKEIIEL